MSFFITLKKEGGGAVDWKQADKRLRSSGIHKSDVSLFAEGSSTEGGTRRVEGSRVEGRRRLLSGGRDIPGAEEARLEGGGALKKGSL